MSRQAYYDAKKQEQNITIAQMIVLCLVRETRQIMPMIGTRKLIQQLSIPLKEHGIKMGRDQLFEFPFCYDKLMYQNFNYTKMIDSRQLLFNSVAQLKKDLT